MTIGTSFRISIVVCAMMFAFPMTLVAQSSPVPAKPQHDKIVWHTPDNSIDPYHPQHKEWYTNSDSSCEVYIESDGSVQAVGEDPKYNYHGATRILRQGISVSMDQHGKRHVLDWVFITLPDGSTKQVKDAYSVFWKNCRQEAKNDLPDHVKELFYGYLQ